MFVLRRLSETIGQLKLQNVSVSPMLFTQQYRLQVHSDLSVHGVPKLSSHTVGEVVVGTFVGAAVTGATVTGATVIGAIVTGAAVIGVAVIGAAVMGAFVAVVLDLR